jgi:hypothetical protein
VEQPELESLGPTERAALNRLTGGLLILVFGTLVATDHGLALPWLALVGWTVTAAAVVAHRARRSAGGGRGDGT